jgi:formate dehydrogenase major subunit/formate dehydrogenase alpha subunit
MWSSRWNPDIAPQNGFKPVRELPGEAGIGLPDLPAAIEAGRIKAMYIAGQSHRWSAPIDPELLRALSKLEFLVVEDTFESELTSIAHVVLPAAMYLEKDGTFTNLDRTVQRVRLAVSAPGDAHPTTWYVAELARRLGYSFGYTNPVQVMDEITAINDHYAGISYPRLERAGMQWPVAAFGAEQTVYLAVGNGLVADELRVIAD